MSTELLVMLDEAKRGVFSHPKGELVLPIRRKVWNKFGEYGAKDAGKVIQTIGLRRRAELDILCVKHVMNIWNSERPNDNRLIEILKMIDDYFNSNIGKDALRHIKNNFWTDCEEMLYENESSMACYVGFATIGAVCTSYLDKSLVSDHIDSRVLDDELDPFSWDASYYAAIAYAGGASTEENSSIDKRREFWLWYLNEAVPKAYEAYKD
ncbi:immunity protein imm5 [Lucifera butyrica]|uniref:Immunity protein imm5 n=1 Tax=Lucifera butyrica TaxID=1351585 RepID=A0A498RAF3_9FIRM|nr:Imm5 family immunity protein [Lucifera butyrica]VBB06148.1 immunity protein imm5 [Lucifera butyrica]